MDINRIVNRQGGDHPERDIGDLLNPLYKAGVPKELLPSFWELTKSHGTLLLALQNVGDNWVVKGGGNISRDFVNRYNNLSFSVTLPDESTARELFDGIKAEPNATLDTVMYRIFEPNGEGKYLPMARHKEDGVHRMISNPFVEPITQVLSAELK